MVNSVPKEATIAGHKTAKRQTIVITQSLLEILPKIAGWSLSNCFSKSSLAKKNLNFRKHCLQVRSLQINVLQTNINLSSVESSVIICLTYRQ